MSIRPNPVLDTLTKDSGILIENFKAKYESATDYDALIDKIMEAMETPDYLGVTRGGVGFSTESENRVVEYDGRRVRHVGDFVTDAATPKITTNLLLHTIENLRRVYAMSDVVKNADTGKTSLRQRIGSPRPEDYMGDVCWIREQTNGDIEINTLFNAINIANPSETGADKSESEMPVEFVANASGFDDTAYAPWEKVVWTRVQDAGGG